MVFTKVGGSKQRYIGGDRYLCPKGEGGGLCIGKKVQSSQFFFEKTSLGMLDQKVHVKG